MRVRSASRGPARSRTTVAWILAGGLVIGTVASLPHERLELERFTLAKSLVVDLIAPISVLLLLGGARRVHLGRVEVYLLGFLALGVISTGLATNRWLALRGLGVSWSAVAIFWAARGLSGAGTRVVLGAGVGGAALVAASSAIVEARGVVALSLPCCAPGGTIGHRNYLAHLLAISLPVLLWWGSLAWGSARRSGARAEAGSRGGAGATLHRTLALAAVFIVSAAIVQSRSRAGWIGAAAGASTFAALVLALVLPRRRGARAAAPGSRTAQGRAPAPSVSAGAEGAGLTLGLAVSLAAAAAGCAAGVLSGSRLAWRSDSPYRDSLEGLVDTDRGSGPGRLIQYANTARMAKAHLLVGVGPGNWSVEYPQWASPGDPSFRPARMMPVVRLPSSSILGVLAERGLPAFVLVILGVVALARRGARALVSRGHRGAPNDGALSPFTVASRPTDGPRTVPFGQGRGLRAAALFGVLASLAVVSALDLVLLSPLGAAWAALVLGALAPRAPGVPVRWSVPARSLALVLTLVPGAAFLARDVAQLRAGVALHHRESVEDLERAAGIDPGNYSLRVLLANEHRAHDRCEEGAVHARAARELQPHAPYAAALLEALEACR